MQILENSFEAYRNPFSQFNANVMDTNTLLDFWCDPFSFVQFANLSHDDIYSDPNPIVFMGGRGTGKTMFLRYWSHEIQKAKYEREGKNYLDETKAIGFYIRINGPVLRSLDGLGLGIEQWDAIFSHLLELYIAKSYFDFISTSIVSGDILSSDIDPAFFKKCSKLIANKESDFKRMEDIMGFIEDRISEVTKFRARRPLSDIDFDPLVIYPTQELSLGLIKVFKTTIASLNNDFKFILLIDEYENFLLNQQRVVNTNIKFANSDLTYRIGMRLEGFRTSDTINPDDFIKEGRDYRKIVFEEVLIKNSGYQDYLKGIVNKRLEKVEYFKKQGLVDIESFLGKKENLVEEAKEIVGERSDKIFDHYSIPEDIDTRRLLENKENPLLQILNCLWYVRSETSLKNKKSVAEINSAMNDYLNKTLSKDGKKYKMDYVDKYKLSLTFVLASIFKNKSKSYYSFNTFSYLSSGIVGHFIELCRRSFQHAEFEDKAKLLEKGSISKHLQNKAALELAESEIQQVRRIESYGNLLYVFTLNLGNIFRLLHRDKKVRYPETNQFSTDKTLLDGITQKAFEAAQRWSIVQLKSKKQQMTIGKQKNDIFTLNRIFAPLFETSYRTRGGYSEVFSTEEMKNMMVSTDFSRSGKEKPLKKEMDDGQQELDF